MNSCLDYSTEDVARNECARLGNDCGGVVLADKTSGGLKSRGAKDGNYGY